MNEYLNDSTSLNDCTKVLDTNVNRPNIMPGSDPDFALHIKKLECMESLKKTIDDLVKEISPDGFTRHNVVLMTADKENGYRIAMGCKVKKPAYRGEFMRPALMISLYEDGQNNMLISMTHCLNDKDKIIQRFDVSTEAQYHKTEKSIINYLKRGYGKRIFRPEYSMI